MTLWPLLAILTTAALLAFVWPWVDPYLERRDVKARLLDRLEEEWDREGEPPAKDWVNW